MVPTVVNIKSRRMDSVKEEVGERERKKTRIRRYTRASAIDLRASHFKKYIVLITVVTAVVIIMKINYGE